MRESLFPEWTPVTKSLFTRPIEYHEMKSYQLIGYRKSLRLANRVRHGIITPYTKPNCIGTRTCWLEGGMAAVIRTAIR